MQIKRKEQKKKPLAKDHFFNKKIKGKKSFFTMNFQS